MKHALIALAAALAACSPASAPTPAADSAETAEPAAPVAGEGVVTAIDAASGSVTLAHEPIEAIGWPAMTMRFSADPALLEGLAVGDAVSFELESARNTGTVTRIAKR